MPAVFFEKKDEEKETPINEIKPLWTKMPKDCSDEEFMALYEQHPEYDEYDDEFIEREPEYTEAIARYIDEHMEKFAVIAKDECADM